MRDADDPAGAASWPEHDRQPDAEARLGPAHAVLLAILRDAQSQGSIGRNADLGAEVAHALAFADAWASVEADAPACFVDLGSGGGLPGLVLAALWPSSTALLIDSQLRRARSLEEAAERLAGSARIDVRHGRAEDLARQVLRGRAELVVARAFGPPATVAECAAGFLRVGGHLLISDPPDGDRSRWDHPDALALVGLALRPTDPDADAGGADAGGIRVLDKVAAGEDRFPRQSASIGKRPLF